MAHEDKLIDHLSTEIETQTSNLITFRSRINLSVFLGPFVLLGSLLIASRGVPLAITIDRWTVAACVVLSLSYIVMGMACAAIERHMWRQCNVWRRLIARVANDSTTKIGEEDLTFRERLRFGYAVVYGAMILAFLCTLQIISRMSVVVSP